MPGAPDAGLRRRRPDSPPVESLLLRGDTDPVLAAAQRLRERGTCERRSVVLLREMRRDHVLETRAVERGEQAAGGCVVQVAEGTGDALLEPLRIVAAPEQI